MASLRISDRMNVTAMYNGYLQSQGDGTAQVNDTTEIHRVLHSFSLVPTYNLPGELFDHTISLSANYTENRDLNKFSVGQTDVKTLALGASYNLNVKPWETNFTFSLSHQNTKGFNSEYSSDVAVKKEDAMGNPKDNSLESQGDRYADQIADFANLSSDGDKGSRSTGIGATMNFGCEYTLPAYRQLKFGFLSSTRINGKYSWTDARLSANVAPLSWLDGGMSFSVNSFTASMGWVINAHPKGFNFFIGMDHILGKTSKEFIPLSSNASLNLGMNVTF